MAKASVRKDRQGKSAFQVFIDPLSHRRFAAACSFAGKNQSDAIEALMNEYADAMGIPADVPPPPRKPR